jgi:hypothetical protein
MLAALGRLSEWATNYRMEFNHTKCVTVVFSRHHASTADKVEAAKTLAQLHFPPARSGGGTRELATAEHAKYLGLTLDRRLTWAPQLEAITKRAMETARKITRVIRPASPPHPVVVRRLVTGILLPQITYALEHWHPTETALTRMRAVLVRPLAKSLALPYTSNHASLLAEFNVPSVSAYQQRMRVRSFHRALTLPPAHPTHCLMLDQRRLVTGRLTALHLCSQLRLALDAEASLLRAHDQLRYAPLAWHYRTIVPVTPSPRDGALQRLLRARSDAARENVQLQRPRAGAVLARAALVVSLDEWRHTTRNTASPLQCITLPDIPLYLSSDQPPARRIRARLRHDRTLTQAYRHMCFGRDQDDPRFVDSPNCLHDDCARSGERETGRHAVLACPPVAAQVASLRADLHVHLDRTPDDEELWLLLLGCCPAGASVDVHNTVLSITAQFLLDTSESRRPRNARLMPLAYPLRAPAAPQ